MAVASQAEPEPIGRDTFHEHLRRLRARAGITQKVAARAAVSLSSWAHYETGATLPPLWRAAPIARALAVSLPELLDPNPERVHVAELTVTPAALARIRRHGAPELERAAEQITAGAITRLRALTAAPPRVEPKLPRNGRPAARAVHVKRRLRERAALRANAVVEPNVEG
jgi:transcriptional regulator with XRE-family HTH domain